MQLHPIVESILATGEIELADGRRFAASSHISRDECELLYRQIAQSGATRAIEVGMAFAISSLCLCDALTKNASSKGVSAQLISMDPAQHDAAWQGVGLNLLQQAGFEKVVQFHEATSQLVLPELVRQGVQADFVFIDGWHTFDHTLVDFFFADLLLVDGGMIVFDDVGYPAINAALRFVLSNRRYDFIEALRDPAPPLSNRIKRKAKTWLGGLSRTDRTPQPKDQLIFREFQFAHSVAIRKRGRDDRRWDHYASF